jgi:hypothetical protein
LRAQVPPASPARHLAPTATRVQSIKVAGSGEPLVTKRRGGCGCSCPPLWEPARRSGRGFRGTRLPVRKSALRWFCARCRRGCCAAAWLSYRERNRPPCVAVCSWGVPGRCVLMGRYSWSTAVPLMSACLTVVAHDKAGGCSSTDQGGGTARRHLLVSLVQNQRALSPTERHNELRK